MNGLKITGAAVAWIVVATTLATPARAALVTFSFSGEVTQVIDDNGLLGGEVDVGTPFFGEYTFESTTPDSQPLDPTFGEYLGSVTSLSGMVGAFPFTANGLMDIGISNDRTSLSYDFYSLSGDVDFVEQTLDFFIQFNDPGGTIFSSDSLPLNPPPIDVLSSARFGIFAQPGVLVNGDISLIVPEPGTLTVLCVGVAFFARRRLRDSWCRFRQRSKRTNTHLAMSAICVLGILSCAPG